MNKMDTDLDEKGLPGTLSRVLIAAAHSGSGKTMITCGLLHLLKRNGIDVISYKCGPDYIDPMYHRKVLGISGGNLDTYFGSANGVRTILNNCHNSHAVMEGVMGIYDGIGGLMVEGSSYDVAKASKTPVILVVDGYGSGRTLISLIKGILADDYEKLIKGIILNRVSSEFFKRLSPLLEEELKNAGSDASIIGAIPVIKDIKIDSRHLGLMMPDEIPSVLDNVSRMADVIEECCQVNKILEIMDSAEALPVPRTYLDEEKNKKSFRVSVARDEAFCFYYKENLEFLESIGGKLTFFSPLHDKEVPAGTEVLLLGGGYPENHLRELSENSCMLESIRTMADNNVLILAECGGFMYLHDSITGADGSVWNMASVISGQCRYTGKLVRFGYVELDGENANKYHLNGVRAHEFHYYDSTNNGNDVTLNKAGSDMHWQGMHISDNRIMGFPHLYYQSNPYGIKKFIYNFIESGSI